MAAGGLGLLGTLSTSTLLLQLDPRSPKTEGGIWVCLSGLNLVMNASGSPHPNPGCLFCICPWLSRKRFVSCASGLCLASF